MKRLKDWEQRLVAYLQTKSQAEFKPGENDCALFVGGAVEAMTGENHFDDWFRAYDSLSEGLKALKAAGYKDHVAYVASILPDVHPAFAHKGDVAVLKGEGRSAKALGIVQGEGVYALTTAGMVIVNRSQIIKAFRV